MRQILLLFSTLMILCDLYAAEVDIDVLGLFKDSAMLEINGQQVLMRVGDRTKQGITLVSADSREAVIDLNGKLVTLNLSSQIGTEFRAPESTIVTIAPALPPGGLK